MKLEGKYNFAAPQQIVWDMLQDPEVIGSIIPGSQGLEEVAENQFHAALIVKVGPIKGKFEGSVELKDINAPDSYTMLIHGKGPAGHVDGEGFVRLEHEDGTTTMHYTGDAKVGGKIAAIGQRLLDMTAKAITKQSLKMLAQKVEKRIEEENI